MSVMSQGVLVLLVVFFGSPMTMTDGGPKAGKVASKLVGNWRGRAERSSPTFLKPSGGSARCIKDNYRVAGRPCGRPATRSYENNRSCPRTLRRSAPSAPIMGCRCHVLMVSSALTGGSYGHISFFGSRQRDPSTDRISDEASGDVCRVLVAASFAGGS